MAMTKRIVLTLCFMLGLAAWGQSSPQQQQQQQQAPLDAAALDKVLAPIALYPDALVAQILMCSTDVTKVRDLQAFIQKNKKLKGTSLQEAAGKQGFDPSYVALTLFPQVVKTMNDSVGWTRQMGQAFNTDKKAVFESIQRLRTLALDVGNLKTTPQQEVQKVDQGGQQVIVIQPANPQVVYVPQYNPETIYTTPAPPVTQTIVVHEDDNSDAVAAGMIGFGVGVAMGAAMNNNYYYGPYGWGGYGMAYGGFYGSGYDDVLDHREDMMEDHYEHREDMQENRKEMAEDREGKTSSERQSTRQQSSTERQATRDQRSTDRQSGTSPSASSRQAGTTPSTSDRQTSRQAGGASASTQDLGSRSSSRGAGVSSPPSGYDSRGYGQSPSQTSRSQSSSGAGGMSGYERGSSTKSTSSRGRSSMGGGGGGGRSRGGGGGRRR
jgi:Protein of unknown function (DUF3300)